MAHAFQRIVIGISIAFTLCGCMNLYVRCPGTDPEITKTYQCTEDMFVISYVVMFP
jgi:hypothetical protein